MNFSQVLQMDKSATIVIQRFKKRKIACVTYVTLFDQNWLFISFFNILNFLYIYLKKLIYVM